MAKDDRTKLIPRRTPESAAMAAEVQRAMAITAALNRLTYSDLDQVRTLFSDLLGKAVDASFVLIPPFYATGGANTYIGRNVFVNQNCTFYDLGGLSIADDVMIGPNVSLITSGHPIEPSERRNRQSYRDREKCLDRSGCNDHRRCDGGGKFGCRGGFDRHEGRSSEHPCRGQSGADHSFDW
jgi:hypothetical protein